MRIGFIDPPTTAGFARRLTYAEPGALDDLDIVVWRPAALFELFPVEAAGPRTPGGVKAVGLAKAQHLVLMSRHWREEFDAFVSRGGTLAILDPGDAKLSLHTMQDIVEHDSVDAFRSPFMGRLGAASDAVACSFGEPFKSFFEAVGDRFLAASRFDPGSAQSMAVEASSGQPCALYLYRHPGRVMVLPALGPAAGAADLDAICTALAAMVSRLSAAAITTGLAGEVRHRQRPESPARVALRDRLGQVIAQRRALQDEEVRLQAALSDIEFIDHLDGDEPDTAMAAAALILQALGAYARPGASGTGSVMFDVDGDIGVLVAVPDDTSMQAIRARLESVVARWSEDLGLAAWPLRWSRSEQPAWPDSAPFVSRDELSRAYASRDRDAPRRWIERAKAGVGPMRHLG